MNKLNTWAFPLLAGLIVIVNAFVLAGVAYNRSESVAVLTLSERELSIPMYRDLEDSGLALSLQYQVLRSDIDSYQHGSNRAPWLDAVKMLSLGFDEDDLKTGNDSGFSDIPEREVYIALEFNGKAYQQMLANVQAWHDEAIIDEDLTDRAATDIDKRLLREQVSSSRLFAIDADTNLMTLQQKYPQDNMLFLKGLVRVRFWANNDTQERSMGYIQSLIVGNINVPYPFNTRLKDLPVPAYNDVSPPDYEVEIHFGKRLEPWIERVTTVVK